jgi:opacity protein-like surface antigen
MRKLKFTLAAGFAGLLTSASAGLAADFGPPIVPPPAPVPVETPCCASGWYLRGDVGMEVDKRADVFQIDVATAPGGAFVDHSLNNTAFAGVGAGYRVNGYFRADVTAEFRGSHGFSAIDRYDFDCDAAGFNFGSCSQGGKITRNNIWNGTLTSQVYLANAYFDLCNCGNLTPFVGAGAGFAHHRMHGITDFDPSDFGGGGHAADGTNTSFAWAVQAGLGYQITPHLTLEMAYRYLNMGDARSGGLNCLPNGCQTGGAFELKNISAQEVKLGMRWQFSGLGGAAAAVVGGCEKAAVVACD